MGYAAAKTLLLTPANSNRLLHKTVLKTLAPHCTAGIIDPNFCSSSYGPLTAAPKGIGKPFTSPTTIPSPRLSLRRYKTKPPGCIKPGWTLLRPHPSRPSPRVSGAQVHGASLGISEGLQAPTRPPGRGAPGLRPPPAAPGRGPSPARPPPAARTAALKRLRGSRWPKGLRS